MSLTIPGLADVRLPPLYRVRQRAAPAAAVDVAAAVRRELARPEVSARLVRGARAAVAVGSRGIAGLPLLVRTLVDELRARGLEVFLVPAMGSHGGATADGQADVLARLGITPDAMGVPVRSAMDAVVVGEVPAPSGAPVPVYMDARAHRDADVVIPVVRIKPHTGFKGRYESGLCKMLAIGLGKHVGCARLHREGYGAFAELIPAAAAVVLRTGKIAFGLAVVEDAGEQTAHVEAVPAERVLDREPDLLALAKRLMPRLPLPRVDVLVIEQIGKDLSGVGMDPNITGRGESGGPLPGYDGPPVGRIVVLGLSPATHGNAHGVGAADLITERLRAAIDYRATWTNTLTAGTLACGKIPVALPTDELAIAAAMLCVPGRAADQVGVVRIRSTLHLSELAVSENLLADLRPAASCDVLGPWNGSWT